MNPYIAGALVIGGAFLFMRGRVNAQEPAQNFRTSRPDRLALPYDTSVLPGEAPAGFLSPPSGPVAWNPGGGFGPEYSPRLGSPMERWPMTPADSPAPSQVVTPVTPAPGVADVPFGLPPPQVNNFLHVRGPVMLN